MSLGTVALARVAPQPWKNGGGSTRVLLTWPDEIDWTLRLSVATIDRDGPFSAFPGIERWFTVIDGAGVVLTLAGERHALAPGDAPLRFDGAAAPGCELLDGPTDDLNLMVRATQAHGDMRLAHAGEDWIDRAAWRACFAADAAVLQIDGTDAATLPAGTLVWSDHAQRQVWRLRGVDDTRPRAWWLAVGEGPR